MAFSKASDFASVPMAGGVRIFALASIVIAMGFLGWGCSAAARHDGADDIASRTPSTHHSNQGSKQDDGPLASIFGAGPHKSGAQLWADNCTRCHYVRPPDYYSAAQWQLVMQHMRSRANLTGVEERKIMAFLKAGSGSEE